MAKLELELGDELSERLERAASKMGLSPSEAAKFILAQALASERSIIDELFDKGREFFVNLIAKKT